MYGRPYGQGLQRPMPPYQQQFADHPSAPHFQPGNSIPLQPVNQQGVHAHGAAPRGPYLHAPPAPMNMPQQGPSVSTSNAGQSYMHPPLMAHNGAAVQLPFLAGQQKFVPGSQNLRPLLPPPPSLGHRAPPPPPFMQLPPPPPPNVPGFFPPVNFESAKPQSTETHVHGVAPLPPPLPPSSPPNAPPPPLCSPSSPGKFSTPTNVEARPPTHLEHAPICEQVHVSESGGNTTTCSPNSGGTPISNDDMSVKESVTVDLHIPPPKPSNEIVIRNIELLCQFIAKNGPDFEEMARKKEAGNPEFDFLVGGDPGSEASCAHEYFLWMKKKCAFECDLLNNQEHSALSQKDVDVGPNSLLKTRKAHSPADSDVDMEDDITQFDKEHGVNNSVEDLKPESVSAGEVSALPKHENDDDLQQSRGISPSVRSSLVANFQADGESKSDKPAHQPTVIHSPFRMIQNYASDNSSDDDGAPCHENVKAVIVEHPLDKSETSVLHEDKEHINVNIRSGIICETESVQSSTACLESEQTKEQDDLQAIKCGLPEATNRSLRSFKTDDLDGRIEGSKANVSFQGKHGSVSSGVDSISTQKDVKKQDKKNNPAASKVDEFGRLVKEDASESESDDSYHLRRRGRRDRSRSRSRSRSPSDKRMKRRSPRRSPRRRKERRSRSPSWSPKRRRSRSRSPYRPVGDSRGERLRRGKIQTPECFDFLKGRCYRGASCRYMHHESEKNENPKRIYSYQHQAEIGGCERNSDLHVASVSIKSPQHNDVKGEKRHLDFDKHDSSDLDLQKCDERRKVEFRDNAVQPSVSHQDVEKLVTDVKTYDASKKGDHVSGAPEEPKLHPPICEEHPSSVIPPTIHHLQDHRHEEKPQKTDNSSKMDSSAVQISAITPSGLSADETSVHMISSGSTPTYASAPDFSHQISHLPPPPLAQQATNAPQGPNMQSDYKSLGLSGSFPPQSVPVDSGLFYQQSHNPVPPYPAWNTLPQSRPPNMVGPSMPVAPLQFQQGNFLMRNDFPGQTPLRAHSGEPPNHSQVGGFPNQTYHLPSTNIPAQPFASSNVVRDNRYSQFGPGMTSQPMQYQGDPTVRNTQSFPGDNLLVSESSKTSFQNQQSVSGYPSNLHGRDSSSTVFDVGGSAFSTHYNPYASTFDQPLSTRFSSITFTQGREATAGIKHDGSFDLGHAPIDGQTAGDNGSRKIISSSNSSKAGGQPALKTSGDQYDPLFDSIDPFAESLKHTQKQDHAAENSDILLKFGTHHNVLDVGENSKHKVVGAVASTASLENDEFGETADAEVGAVENGSPSNANEDADIAEGDIEIDQVKPEGRTKKNKDSKSMKLFKVAVANFVKDVLKPQWRQGNMSKEVFKTIVKKTVDKVSGAMKNRRLPKSQEKIDHYIDSSRRKLTQLVEGYVSKYKS
ncbi:unnamed protein product [Amaranthus hypochondriacus]